MDFLTASLWLLAGISVVPDAADVGDGGVASAVVDPGLPGGGEGSAWSCSK